MTWMIYGASGFTGALVAEEAVRRGHHPLLAGRSAAKLGLLAQRLGLDYVVFDLEHLDDIIRHVSGVNLVFHAAGPFVITSGPMLRACTLAGAHYLDITGEYPVFENTFAHDALARQQGVALISGVGFDVVPSDCLAVHVAQRVPGASQLEIAIDGLTRLSTGTLRSGLHLIAGGGRVRRDGQLKSLPIGAGATSIRFSQGEKTAIPIPWGDLATAFRSTGIPNITTYAAVPGAAAQLIQWAGPLLQTVMAQDALRSLITQLVAVVMTGPSAQRQQLNRAHLWARASDDQGAMAEAWMETAEPYRFTALAGVQAVERVLAEHPLGALTPAQAFGANFALVVEGTQLRDSL